MSSDQIKVELQAIYGDDRVISNCAWTSSTTRQGKDKKTDEDVARVINMLADEKHSVPFESVVFRFWLKIPITIDRQVEKHRVSSQNGMSGRYRTMPSEYLETSNDVDAIINKIQPPGPYDFEIFYSYYEICEKANTYYQLACKLGKEAEKSGKISNTEYKRFREFYRGLLPQHNMTEKVITINLRSLANFIKLRNKPNAQPEIQQVAQMMLEEIKKHPQISSAITALERNGWNI